jgi:hypothetical protein
MIFTAEHLELGKSSNGAWSVRQMKMLDVNHKKTGWQKRAIGKEYPTELIEQFIALKDQHLTDGKNVFQLRKEKKMKKRMEKAGRPNATMCPTCHRPLEVEKSENLTEQFFFATEGI